VGSASTGSALPPGVTLRLVENIGAIEASLFTAIHQYLSEVSYWARGIPAATLARAIDHSLSVIATRQVEGKTVLAGFARIVSDRATYAYLCDVFVLPEAERQGLAHAMLMALDQHPDLQGLRRWMLMTRDAHSLYAKFGYAPLSDPARVMARHDPDIYIKP
jgi:GNAT superfamily N-acetyltransferase